MDGFLPHLPTRFILRSQQSRSPLSILLNTFYQIPMAYSSNSSFYPSSSTPSEFNTYPSLRQTSAAEQASVQASSNFTHDRDADGSFLDNLYLTQKSSESVSSDTSYAVPEEISFPRHYWPVIGQYAQSYRSGIPSQDNASASTMAEDVVLASNSGKQLCNSQTSRSLVLTNYEQSRSTAKGPTRAGHPPAYSR